MLNELILETHDKASIHRIIDYVGTNPKHLKELLDVFLGNNARISQQTSWALSNIGEKHPEMFLPYHQLLLDKLQEKQSHNSESAEILYACISSLKFHQNMKEIFMIWRMLSIYLTQMKRLL